MKPFKNDSYIFFVLFALFSVIVSSSKLKEHDTLITLKSQNFRQMIHSSDFFLVEFFWPSCSHCIQFAPIYKELAQTIRKDFPNVRVGTVDATVETDLADEFEIYSVPTLILFKKRGSSHEVYEDSRDPSDILAFIREKVQKPDSEGSAQESQKSSFLLKTKSQVKDPVCVLNRSF